MIELRAYLAATAVVTALTVSHPASAATLTFEIGEFNFSTYPFSYEQDGFRVTNVGPTGTEWGFAGQPSGVLSIARADGSPFTFSGLSAGTYAFPSSTLMITSTLLDSGAGPSSSVILKQNVFSSFDATASFGNTPLHSLTLNFGAADHWSSFVDDIKVSFTVASVPGPIAGAGLPALMALGGFVWARRRKAAVAA